MHYLVGPLLKQHFYCNPAIKLGKLLYGFSRAHQCRTHVDSELAISKLNASALLHSIAFAITIFFAMDHNKEAANKTVCRGKD